MCFFACCALFQSALRVILYISLVNGRDGKKVGREGYWMVVRRVKPPWKDLALRPPGPRVVLAARPAEWALSQTSVCSLLLELLAGWMGGGGEGGAGELEHSATTNTNILPGTDNSNSTLWLLKVMNHINVVLCHLESAF